MATIKDVAQEAGVSYTTVSHVINKTRPVNKDTAARVRDAIKKLRYRPNRIARNLRKQETRTIGIINSVTNDPYFAEIAMGLERACYAHGYTTIAVHSDMSPEKEKDNLEMLLEKGIDGLIIHSVLNKDILEQLIEEESFPVIFLQHYIPEMRMDSFCVDDSEGTRLAMEHLINLGHTRIACISGHTQTKHAHHQRKIVWQKMAKEVYPDLPEEYKIETCYKMEDGYQAIQQLLALPEPPTAIFCYSDNLAIGAIRGAIDAGVRIPEDISIVSYDNLLLSQYLIPRLTTIHQPKAELGDILFQRIKERIDNPDIEPKLHVLPPELIVRESTGPVKR